MSIRFLSDTQIPGLGVRTGQIAQSKLEELLGRPVVPGADGRPIVTAKEEQALKLAIQVMEIMDAHPALDKDARQRVLSVMEEMRGKQLTKTGILEVVKQTVIGEETVIAAEPWANGPIHLERAEGSAFHKMKAEWREGRVSIPGGDYLETMPDDIRANFDEPRQIFVVQHDWAGAFKTAKDFDGGEINLPHELCAFEYRISGRRVIADLVTADNGPTICTPVIHCSNDRWVVPWLWTYEHGKMTPYRGYQSMLQSKLAKDFFAGCQRVVDLIGESIRAISISLEAQAASTETVRADYKLNRAREKAGKLPIYDYHVVSLSRRSRPAPLPRDPNAEARTSPRLHFRRGHWRHFDNHKTWINWMLVGNPDLGFIDKHYKL